VNLSEVIVTTTQAVIALYEECKDYRLMHRDIYGPDQYVEQLDFWTRTEIEHFGSPPYSAEKVSAMTKMVIDMGIRPADNVDSDFVAAALLRKMQPP
jgi:hypothetical protein